MYYSPLLLLLPALLYEEPASAVHQLGLLGFVWLGSGPGVGVGHQAGPLEGQGLETVPLRPLQLRS